MTRGGWIINNIHLLEELIDLAFTDLREYNAAGFNYFDRRKSSIEAWYNGKAMEMLEKDPTLSSQAITSQCAALCNSAHQIKMEHRAKALMMDPAIRFPEYGSAISERPMVFWRSFDSRTYSGPCS